MAGYSGTFNLVEMIAFGLSEDILKARIIERGKTSNRVDDPRRAENKH